MVMGHLDMANNPVISYTIETTFSDPLNDVKLLIGIHSVR